MTTAAISFVSDDVNDFWAMTIAVMSAAPVYALPPVLTAAALTLSRSGRHGAVRELIGILLAQP